jgi:hypothetical protein
MRVSSGSRRCWRVEAPAENGVSRYAAGAGRMTVDVVGTKVPSMHQSFIRGIIRSVR